MFLLNKFVGKTLTFQLFICRLGKSRWSLVCVKLIERPAAVGIHIQSSLSSATHKSLDTFTFHHSGDVDHHQEVEDWTVNQVINENLATQKSSSATQGTHKGYSSADKCRYRRGGRQQVSDRPDLLCYTCSILFPPEQLVGKLLPVMVARTTPYQSKQGHSYSPPPVQRSIGNKLLSCDVTQSCKRP